MLKHQYLTETEVNGLMKLEAKINDKNTYILLEEKNGMLHANLYIWGPAFESYFLMGFFKYNDYKAFETDILQDIAEIER